MSDSGPAPSRPLSHSLIVVALAAILGLLCIHARWRPDTWLLSDGLFYMNTARAVLELAGIKDIRTKSQGSNNPINCVKATIEGLRELRTAEQIARLRGISAEGLH